MFMGNAFPPRWRSSRGPRQALLFLWAVFVVGLLLGGCTSLKDRQARALNLWAKITGTGVGAVQTAREGVEGAVEAGKEVVDDVRRAAKKAGDVVQDVDRRVGEIKEGIGKIQEGKALIEWGLSGEDEAGN
jgi:hypothetical protein